MYSVLVLFRYCMISMETRQWKNLNLMKITPCRVNPPSHYLNQLIKML